MTPDARLADARRMMLVFLQALPATLVCFFLFKKETDVVGRLLAADGKVIDVMFYFEVMAVASWIQGRSMSWLRLLFCPFARAGLFPCVLRNPGVENSQDPHFRCQMPDSHLRRQMPDSQMPDVLCSFFCAGSACDLRLFFYFKKKQTLLVACGCRQIKHWNHALI